MIPNHTNIKYKYMIYRGKQICLTSIHFTNVAKCHLMLLRVLISRIHLCLCNSNIIRQMMGCSF